jgi:hypothetical protein
VNDLLTTGWKLTLNHSAEGHAWYPGFHYHVEMWSPHSGVYGRNVADVSAWGETAGHAINRAVARANKLLAKWAKEQAAEEAVEMEAAERPAAA